MRVFVMVSVSKASSVTLKVAKLAIENTIISAIFDSRTGINQNGFQNNYMEGSGKILKFIQKTNLNQTLISDFS